MCVVPTKILCRFNRSLRSFLRTRPQYTSLTLRYGVSWASWCFVTKEHDHQTNTTQQLAGPTIKDPKATYFASTNSLVQLSSNGTVSFLPYQEGNTSVNAAASWSTVKSVASAAPPSSSSASASGTQTASGSGSTGTSSGSTGGALAGSTAHVGLVLATLLGAMACLL